LYVLRKEAYHVTTTTTAKATVVSQLVGDDHLGHSHRATGGGDTPSSSSGVVNSQGQLATGYRPPSNALANPQPAHLQSIDEIDATILAAGKELQAQGIKVTGIAIANMTGIAERTVYDRLAKMKQKGGDV
jgi:hypothetical protein